MVGYYANVLDSEPAFQVNSEQETYQIAVLKVDLHFRMWYLLNALCRELPAHVSSNQE